MRPVQFTPWPAERTAELKRLCTAGRRPAEIAAALGVSRQVVHEHAARIGHRFGRVAAHIPQPSAPAPDILPLVERALADDPAGEARAGGNEGSRKRATASWPAHVAAYVANVELGFSARSVARTMATSHALVRYAVRRVEDRRDDPVFDAFVERLGDRVRAACA